MDKRATDQIEESESDGILCVKIDNIQHIFQKSRDMQYGAGSLRQSIICISITADKSFAKRLM